MKTLMIFSMVLLSATAFSQDPVNSYTNGNINAVPTVPYNGTNPAGQPAQNTTYTTTVPGVDPSSTGTNPINPASTSPASPKTNTYPTSPGMPPNNIHRLYQDPMRTPKSPGRSGNVTTVDGSNGKYRAQHHVTPAKKNGFTSHRRTKGVRSKSKHVSREKTSD